MEHVVPAASLRERVSDFVSLTKPGITSSVLLTAAVGYWLGLVDGFDPLRLAWLLIGTGAASGGACALNMVLEREGDARMARTRMRPLPDGRIRPAHALLFGLALAIGGIGFLALGVNTLAAGITAAVVLGYVFAYTPLKPLTSWSTWVGIPVGAAPPLIGWAAATGRLDAGAWTLFALMALWQVPHILSMAWMNREDYLAVEYPLAPIHDGDERRASVQMIASLTALIVASALPFVFGVVGWLYLVPTLLAGAWWLRGGVRFARERSRINARRVFFQSLLWLPWTMLFLSLGKVG